MRQHLLVAYIWFALLGLGLGVLLATELLGVKSGGGGGGGAGIVLFFLREPAASSSLDSLEPYPVGEVCYNFFSLISFSLLVRL